MKLKQRPHKLQSEEIRRKNITEVKNRFEALRDIEDPEEEHDMILETYRDESYRAVQKAEEAMDRGQNMGKN